MEKWAEDRYELADGFLVSPAGMAEDVDPTRLVSELFAIVSKLLT